MRVGLSGLSRLIGKRMAQKLKRQMCGVVERGLKPLMVRRCGACGEFRRVDAQFRSPSHVCIRCADFMKCRICDALTSRSLFAHGLGRQCPACVEAKAKRCKVCDEVFPSSSFPKKSATCLRCLPNTEKLCSTCQRTLPGNQFRAAGKCCMDCGRKRAREYQRVRLLDDSHRQKARASIAEWKARNPEKVRDQRMRERVARGVSAPMQERLDRDVRLRAQHVKYLARMRLQAAKLSPAERYRIKMATSPSFVLNMRMRNAIKKALRGGKAGRRWEALVGYTLADLVAHLERQMPKGYSLANIGDGRIHIDHIVPKSMFDVTTEDGLRAAWALPNLRPVLAEVNLRKHARREFLL